MDINCNGYRLYDTDGSITRLGFYITEINAVKHEEGYIAKFICGISSEPELVYTSVKRIEGSLKEKELKVFRKTFEGLFKNDDSLGLEGISIYLDIFSDGKVRLRAMIGDDNYGVPISSDEAGYMLAVVFEDFVENLADNKKYFDTFKKCYYISSVRYASAMAHLIDIKEAGAKKTSRAIKRFDLRMERILPYRSLEDHKIEGVYATYTAPIGLMYDLAVRKKMTLKGPEKRKFTQRTFVKLGIDTMCYMRNRIALDFTKEGDINLCADFGDHYETIELDGYEKDMLIRNFLIDYEPDRIGIEYPDDAADIKTVVESAVCSVFGDPETIFPPRPNARYRKTDDGFIGADISFIPGAVCATAGVVLPSFMDGNGDIPEGDGSGFSYAVGFKREEFDMVMARALSDMSVREAGKLKRSIAAMEDSTNDPYIVTYLTIYKDGDAKLYLCVSDKKKEIYEVPASKREIEYMLWRMLDDICRNEENIPEEKRQDLYDCFIAARNHFHLINESIVQIEDYLHIREMDELSIPALEAHIEGISIHEEGPEHREGETCIQYIMPSQYALMVIAREEQIRSDVDGDSPEEIQEFLSDKIHGIGRGLYFIQRRCMVSLLVSGEVTLFAESGGALSEVVLKSDEKALLINKVAFDFDPAGIADSIKREIAYNCIGNALKYNK